MHAWTELNTMSVSYNVTTVIKSSKAIHSAPTDTKPSVSFACIMFSLYWKIKGGSAPCFLRKCDLTVPSDLLTKRPVNGNLDP